jgi:hypothetical protein
VVPTRVSNRELRLSKIQFGSLVSGSDIRQGGVYRRRALKEFPHGDT